MSPGDANALADLKQTIDDIKAGVRRPDGRRAQRALDEARWKFLPTTGITKQVPREDKVPCPNCDGTGLADARHTDEFCTPCEATGQVSRVRLVPFVVRSPITAKRENIARAFAHESCEPFGTFAEPRALRVDAYARGHRNVQMSRSAA